MSVRDRRREPQQRAGRATAKREQREAIGRGTGAKRNAKRAIFRPEHLHMYER